MGGGGRRSGAAAGAGEPEPAAGRAGAARVCGGGGRGGGGGGGAAARRLRLQARPPPAASRRFRGGPRRVPSGCPPSPSPSPSPSFFLSLPSTSPSPSSPLPPPPIPLSLLSPPSPPSLPPRASLQGSSLRPGGQGRAISPGPCRGSRSPHCSRCARGGGGCRVPPSCARRSAPAAAPSRTPDGRLWRARTTLGGSRGPCPVDAEQLPKVSVFFWSDSSGPRCQILPDAGGPRYRTVRESKSKRPWERALPGRCAMDLMGASAGDAHNVPWGRVPSVIARAALLAVPRRLCRPRRSVPVRLSADPAGPPGELDKRVRPAAR